MTTEAPFFEHIADLCDFMGTEARKWNREGEFIEAQMTARAYGIMQQFTDGFYDDDDCVTIFFMIGEEREYGRRHFSVYTQQFHMSGKGIK